MTMYFRQKVSKLQTVRHHFNIYTSSSVALRYDSEMTPQTCYITVLI